MLRRFGADRRGLAAMEFALIAPIMVALYMGMAELTLAMMAERRASHAASVVADLVSQSSQMNAAQMTDIFEVGDAILKPFPAEALQLRVSSVKADPTTGVAAIVWSQGQGLAVLTAMPATFPANLLAAGDSVIMAEVSYAYASPLQHLLPDTVTFNRTFYLRPRRAIEVAWVSG